MPTISWDSVCSVWADVIRNLDPGRRSTNRPASSWVERYRQSTIRSAARPTDAKPHLERLETAGNSARFEATTRHF